MKNHLLIGAVALSMTSISQAAITVLTPIDAVSVTDDGSATSVGSLNAGVTGTYPIRERRATTQSDRQISSFFQFDISSLSVTDVTTPGFQALFRIDYVSQLNALTPSNAAPAILGQVVSGDGWDSTSGTDFPLHDWGFDEATNTTTATNTQTLITDIPSLAPTVNDVTVDMTSSVTAWVDGTADNYGFVLFINKLEAQGAGFDNPELVIDVPAIPEPSSMMLAGLGLLGGLVRRHR